MTTFREPARSELGDELGEKQGESMHIKSHAYFMGYGVFVKVVQYHEFLTSVCITCWHNVSTYSLHNYMGMTQIRHIKLQINHQHQYIPQIIHILPAPDSKIHGPNMGPTWVLSAPDGPHVGPMNLAIRGLPVFCSPWVPIVCYISVSFC